MTSTPDVATPTTPDLDAQLVLGSLLARARHDGDTATTGAAA